MGQELLNHPSVEGWHTGVGCVNSGALLKGVNFAADLRCGGRRPGVAAVV